MIRIIKNPCTIIIGGLYRSGSTWQFNVIRIALQLSGYKVTWGEALSVEKSDYHIIKIHRFYPAWAKKADFVFTSHRDIEGVKDSWLRFKGEKLLKLRTILRWYKQWNKFSVYNMPFKDVGRLETIKKIIGILQIKVNAEDVFRAVESIKPPKEGKDETTLLFHNHISK